MSKYKFSDDIEVGEKGEQIVRIDLESEGAIYLNDNKTHEYDLNMTMPNGKNSTFEVKTDEYCRPDSDTTNLFIEFESWGKPSGLTTTKAKYFVMYYPYLKDIWYIKTSKLRQLIKDNDFVVKEWAGDAKSGTKGYLIPRYQFKEHFKVRIPQTSWD